MIDYSEEITELLYREGECVWDGRDGAFFKKSDSKQIPQLLSDLLLEAQTEIKNPYLSELVGAGGICLPTGDSDKEKGSELGAMVCPHRGHC